MINSTTKQNALKRRASSVILAAAMIGLPGIAAAGYGNDGGCLTAGKTVTAYWETKEHNILVAESFPVHYSRTKMAMGIKAKSTLTKGQAVNPWQRYTYQAHQGSGNKVLELQWNGWPMRGLFTPNGTNTRLGGCDPSDAVVGTLDCMDHDLCLLSKQHKGNATFADSSCGVEFSHAWDYIFWDENYWQGCANKWSN